MKIIFILLCLFFQNAIAEESPIALEKAPIDVNDRASIERGAKFFVENCMSCHTMIYLRYNKFAQKNGVLYDKMPTQVKNWPLGVTPPDLSLVADVRGVDWIYTYLHSFYMDKSRPFGVNNLLVHNTAMAGMLVAYQGQQVLIQGSEGSQQWYDRVVLQQPGIMTPAEFDAAITDVVNFLHYAAAPYQESQHRLGKWVLGYLFILFVLLYFLKKLYWKK